MVMDQPRSPLPIIALACPPQQHVWRLPGSKSMTNRALIIAALADGRSRLIGPLLSDDTRHMAEALTDLGIVVNRDDPDCWLVEGGIRHLRPPGRPIAVGNSGTTVRFLAALAALVDGPVDLVGDEHMARRPIADLVDALTQLGISVDCPSGCPPLRVTGCGRLPGGTVHIDATRSSQYISALLLVAGAAEAPLHIHTSGRQVSRPYITMTAAMITAAGGQADCDGQGCHALPAPYRAGPMAIEPDASAASYAWAAAVATGGSVRVPGFAADQGRPASLQGDLAFLDILERIGAVITVDDGGICVSGDGPRRGVEVDMHDISDTVMTLAALAPLLEGPTTIRNVANIRLKETDRLAALVTELRRLGQEVDHGDDWIRIDPRPLTPALVECYSDHRMAMAFAILGLARPGVTIADPACTAKTYPGFWNDLDSLSKAAHS